MIPPWTRAVGTVIYCLRERGGRYLKVGFATNLDTRVAALQVGNPRVLDVCGFMPAKYDVEAWIHRRLSASHVRSEWFRAGEDVLRMAAFIRDHDGSDSATVSSLVHAFGPPPAAHRYEADPSAMGTRLRVARERAGLTREQLSKTSGVYAQLLWHVEIGKARTLSRPVAERVACALGIAPEELTG